MKKLALILLFAGSVLYSQEITTVTRVEEVVSWNSFTAVNCAGELLITTNTFIGLQSMDWLVLKGYLGEITCCRKIRTAVAIEIILFDRTEDTLYFWMKHNLYSIL